MFNKSQWRKLLKFKWINLKIHKTCENIRKNSSDWLMHTAVLEKYRKNVPQVASIYKVNDYKWWSPWPRQKKKYSVNQNCEIWEPIKLHEQIALEKLLKVSLLTKTFWLFALQKYPFRLLEIAMELLLSQYFFISTMSSSLVSPEKKYRCSCK